MMRRRSFDSDDSNFAIAIAASAHAIHSLEEGSGGSKVHITKTNTSKPEQFRRGQGGKSFTKDTRNTSFVRPSSTTPSSADQRQRHKETSRGHIRNSDAKADAWEKAQIAKIRRRYERMHSEIQAWENEKKLREKRQMERKKNELELRMSRNSKHHQSKLARIDRIAKGARAQLEEKRKQEESVAKEKSRKMRITGIAPVSYYCCCF